MLISDNGGMEKVLQKYQLRFGFRSGIILKIEANVRAHTFEIGLNVGQGVENSVLKSSVEPDRLLELTLKETTKICPPTPSI
jgi:hypothetical protein